MNLKKIFSIFISGILIVNNFTPMLTLHATDNSGVQSRIEQGEVEVKAENSLGAVFSKEISENLERQENRNISVISVEINDKTANITYNTVMDCTAVVAIYDEAGQKLLGTGEKIVTKEETTADIQINIDMMPEYFLVKAYLINDVSLAPLSEVYENPNYTSYMEDFFSKTMEDFDEERIISLDNTTNNNFAVFSEDVILLEEAEEYNNVVLCDDENGIYKFENADETLLSLKSGDMLSYDYGDESELIVVKVDTITKDGTTVTIKAAETGIAEIFEYVRIDKEADQSDAEYNTEEIPNVIESDFTNFDHSDEYTSTESGEQSVDNKSVDVLSNKNYLADVVPVLDMGNKVAENLKRDNFEHKSELDLEIENGKAEVSKSDTIKITLVDGENEPDTNNSNVKIKTDLFSGTLLYTSDISLKLYFAGNGSDLNIKNDSGLINFFEVKWVQKLSVDIALGTSVTTKIPLFKVTYPMGYGFKITLSPKFIIGGDAEIALEGCFTETLGFRVQNGVSSSISEKPHFAPSIKLKGTFYIGLDLAPTISWLSENIARIDFEVSGKFKITAESEVEFFEAGGNGKPKDKHKCTEEDKLIGVMEGCLDGRIDYIVTIGGTGKLFNSDKLKLDLKLTTSIFYKNFYYSSVFDEFDWGKCPHKQYYYELIVLDNHKKPIEDAIVSLNNEKIKTDSNGKALLYFNYGKNEVSITHEDYDNFSETYNVSVSYKNEHSGDVGYSEKNDDTDSKDPTIDANVKLNEKVEIVKINNEEKRSQEVNLWSKAHTVKVMVVDQNGEPVRNAKVSVDYKSDYYATNGTTGSNGVFKLRLPNGEWKINVSSLGCTSASETVTVDGENTEVTMTIVNNACVFTVTDQYGDPVNGAKILFRNTQTNEEISSLKPLTNQDGVYLHSLNVGEYEFTATKKGYDDSSGSFTVSEGGTKVDVEMHCNLRKATITVEDENEKPLSGVSIKSYYDNNSYITDDNGTVTIKHPK